MQSSDYIYRSIIIYKYIEIRIISTISRKLVESIILVSQKIDFLLNLDFSTT